MSKKLKVSFVLNILILLFVFVATIFMLTGFRFMDGEKILSNSHLEVFKYFTVDSNLLMGIASLVFLVFLKKDNSNIPKGIYILKYVATVSVTLTFATTVFYLAPTSQYGFFSFFTNSNLFFHFVIPVLSIITFVFFENTDKISFGDTFFGLIPMGIYSIFYITNVLTHIENGKILPLYDWYGFLKNGINGVFSVIIVMIAATYLICIGLYYLNKKMDNKGVIYGKRRKK